MSKNRKCGLSTLELMRLEHACQVVEKGLGSAPYLVGSAGDNVGYRDVDLRVILSDEEFDHLFGGRDEFWGLVCMAIGAYLAQVSDLPIDFQIQRRTEANEKYGGQPRNPMGHGFRIYAGGGDATRFWAPTEAKVTE